MPSAADTYGGSLIPGYGYFRIGVAALGLLNRVEQRQFIDDPGPAPGTSLQGAGPGSVTRTGPGPRVLGVAALPAVIPQPAPVFSPPTVYYPEPSPPPPAGSGSSGIPPRPPSGGATPPINPNSPPAQPSTVITGAWPYVIGSVILPDVWNWTKQGAVWSYDWYRAGRRSTPATPGGRSRYRNRGRGPVGTPPNPDARPNGDPFPPQGSPPITVIVQMPREPKPPKKQPNPMAGLGGIYVNRARLPVPTVTPTPAKVPLWMQLLPLLGPSLLGFLQPRQGNRTVLNLTDPLTPPATDNGNPFPDTSGLTPFQTQVGDYAAFGGDGAVGSNTCECKPKRKKGRKKKRTVCYSGTFIEGANGIRKYKKRKVQCL